VKILVVSDEVAPQLYSPTIRTRFADVSLVLSCGDLPHYYLEYIVTMLNTPLYYVMGNHGFELAYHSNGKPQQRPEGCIDINDQAVQYRGLIIAGLEGSMRYKDGPYQYTQAEMRTKTLRLVVTLLQHRVTTGHWRDILVTHAPPYGIHDGHDVCHTGFRALLGFMERYRPRYLVHGHSHAYDQTQPMSTRYMDTLVLNAYPFRVLDIEPIDQTPKVGKYGK